MLNTIDEKLCSPAFFAEGDYYGLFKALRQSTPVKWTVGPNGHGFWSLFWHADVKRVLNEPELFSSEREGVMPLMDDQIDEVAEEAFGVGDNILTIDPPRHAEFRQAVAQPFVPKALKAAERNTEALIHEIFDALPEDGECDLVEDLAARIPMAVICDLLQIPREDWGDMLAWGRMAVGGTDPEFQQGTVAETIRKGFRRVRGRGQELALSRRGCPYSDPLTLLANARVGDRPMTDSEVAYNAQTLLLAGFETTRNAFSGGVLALLEHPDQMQLLRDDPKKIRLAVEELVRWSDPVTSIMRVATADTRVGEQDIAAGDRVVLWLASANRDEAAFDEPDRFDVTRHPNLHVGFGAGPHFCLGGPLAKDELRVAVEQLLSRYEGIEITGPIERVQSNFIGGIKRMPMKLRRRAAA
ncbi:MAG: cytochrome P450 [Gammaproteobacteria bacterium]